METTGDMKKAVAKISDSATIDADYTFKVKELEDIS